MAPPMIREKDPEKGLMHKIRTSLTFGVIVSSRGGFPQQLIMQAREEIVTVLEGIGNSALMVSEEDTPFGAVESLSDARKCAAFFKQHADQIDGIIIDLPNFGDERAVANTIRWANLNVPILIHAAPDDMSKMTNELRRDSFCGKISVCNNLKQYGIPFTLTTSHTSETLGDEFKNDLQDFAGVCRVVNGLQHARIGAIGARTTPFKTVRYSEKILEAVGISVETVDLSELIGQANAMEVDDRVNQRIEAIKNYVDTNCIAAEGLEKIAKFAIVLDDWVETNEVDGFAFLCWASIENYFGIVPCAMLGMLNSKLIPAACEVDVMGAISMLALELASATSTSIMDWDNNYAEDPDKAIVFHCSNIPVDWMNNPTMQIHHSNTFKEGCAYGATWGRISAGPFTFARLTTDDVNGGLTYYLGEGDFTDDPVETFGGYGVIKVPELQKLLKKICKAGFEHHFAATRGNVARDPD